MTAEVPGSESELHRPVHPVRFVTAASLFDGHDASINIMRRILQTQGAEVVHLGHNRSVDEVVRAAVSEDVQGIALSSYQGGHLEYFRYLVDRLVEEGAAHIRVFGGGGGVIVPEEIAALHAYGVARIFTPEDGQRLGLAGMVNSMIAECDVSLATPEVAVDELYGGSVRALSRAITSLEEGVVGRETPAAALGSALGSVLHGLRVSDGALADELDVEAAPDRTPPLPGRDHDHLTAREQEVVQLMAEGLSNKQIGDRLGISAHTAKFHVNAVLGKLDASTRTEAVVRALQRGFVML